MKRNLFSLNIKQFFVIIFVNFIVFSRSDTEFLSEEKREVLTGNFDSDYSKENYNQDWLIDYPIVLNIDLLNLEFTPIIRFVTNDGHDLTNYFSISYSNNKYSVKIPEIRGINEFLVYFLNINPRQNLISYCSLNGQLITNTSQEDEWQTRTNTHTGTFNWYNNSSRGRVKTYIYAGYITITDYAKWKNIGKLSNTFSYDNFKDD